MGGLKIPRGLSRSCPLKNLELSLKKKKKMKETVLMSGVSQCCNIKMERNTMFRGR